MRKSTMPKLATVIVAVTLATVVMVTDGAAASSRAAGAGAIASDRFGARFRSGGFARVPYGGRRYYPFGYYGGYGGYGSSSNNGCISLDAHGCEE